MKFLLIALFLPFAVYAHILDANNDAEFSSHPQPITKSKYTEEINPNKNMALTRHLVLFDLKESVTQQQREEIIHRFIELRNSTRNGKPYIHNIEVGQTNISREGVGKGYDLSFIVSFLSQGDLNFYIGQPAINDPNFYDPMHQAFKEFVGPFLKVSKNPHGSDNVGVLVFDYQLTNVD
jgi:hypothetical protein